MPMARQDGAERERGRSVGAIRGLWPFVRPYGGYVWAAFLALTITAMLSLSLPIAVRRVVDGFFGAAMRMVDLYFAAAIGIAALLALGTALRFYLVTRLGERVVADIRKAIYDRVIGMSPAFYERIMTGEVLSRLTTDTTLVLSVISSSVSIALRNLLILAGGLVLLLVTSPKLSALVLVGVPLVVVPILTLGRRLRVLSRASQDRIADSSAQASESLLAAQTVQAYTHEAASRAAFGALTERAFDTARRRIAVRAVLTAIVIFLVFTSIVAVLWIGAHDVRSGSMSPGELVQFVIYSVMVAGSVAALSEVWGELLRAAGATERMVELLNTADTIRDPEQPVALPARVRGEIAFDGVTFRYPARWEIPALFDLELTIRPGETVALVGPSGAGKTTIFQLLMRFFDPDEGRVTLDGIDLRAMARRDLRRQFALVPQDPVIFAASARENIRFGRPEASDAEVEAAARAAAAHEFIARLPRGLRHLCRRARGDAVGRAAAAAGDRPGDPARRAGAAARRGDQRARRRERARGAARGGPAGRGAHHADHRPPAGHGEARGPDRGVPGGADRRRGHPRGAGGGRRALRPAGAGCSLPTGRRSARPGRWRTAWDSGTS